MSLIARCRINGVVGRGTIDSPMSFLGASDSLHVLIVGYFSWLSVSITRSSVRHITSTRCILFVHPSSPGNKQKAFFPGLFAGDDSTRGSDQEGLKMSRVGWGRVNKFSILAGRIGSGQEALKSHGSVQVGSRGFQISRVGSGRFMRCLKCHGSGRVMTRGIRVTRRSGHNDPRVVYG